MRGSWAAWELKPGSPEKLIATGHIQLRESGPRMSLDRDSLSGTLPDGRLTGPGHPGRKKDGRPAKSLTPDLSLQFVEKELNECCRQLGGLCGPLGLVSGQAVGMTARWTVFDATSHVVDVAPDVGDREPSDQMDEPPTL